MLGSALLSFGENMGVYFGSKGFKEELKDPRGDDQVHHALGAIGAQLLLGSVGGRVFMDMREYLNLWIPSARLQYEDLHMNAAVTPMSASILEQQTPAEVEGVARHALMPGRGGL